MSSVIKMVSIKFTLQTLIFPICLCLSIEVFFFVRTKTILCIFAFLVRFCFLTVHSLCSFNQFSRIHSIRFVYHSFLRHPLNHQHSPYSWYVLTSPLSIQATSLRISVMLNTQNASHCRRLFFELRFVILVQSRKCLSTSVIKVEKASFSNGEL